MNYSRSNHKHKTRAQAMVEFALALPLLLLLVFGLMETGRLLFIYASTVSAAREAARYGSAMGKNGSNVSYYKDCQGIRNAAKNVGFINSFSDRDIQISYDLGLDEDVTIINPEDRIYHIGDLTPDDSNVAPTLITPEDPDCGDNQYTEAENGHRIIVSVSTIWKPIVSIVPLEGFTIKSTSERTLIAAISISAPKILTNAEKTATAAAAQTATVAAAQTQTAAPAQTQAAAVAQTQTAAVAQTQAAIAAQTQSAALTQTAAAPPKQITLIVIPSTSPDFTSFKVDDRIEFTYILQNLNNSPITNVSLMITGSFVPAQSGGCDGIIDPASSITCTRFRIIDQTDIDRGSIDATATANGSYTNFWGTIFSVSSNSVLSDYKITQTPNLTIVPTPSASPSEPSSPATTIPAETDIKYTYKLTNDGNVTLSPTVSDNKSTSITCPASLAPRETIECTGTYKVKVGDVTAGRIINTGNVSYVFGANPKVDILTSITVITYIGARFDVGVTANPTSITSLNSQVEFTYTFTNTGSVNLFPPYSLTSSLSPITYDCTQATVSIAPGVSTSCKGIYTVTTNGNKTNTISNARVRLTKNGSSINATNYSPSSTVISVTICDPNTVVLTFDNSQTKTKKWNITNNSGAAVSITTIHLGWPTNKNLQSLILNNPSATIYSSIPGDNSGNRTFSGTTWAIANNTTAIVTAVFTATSNNSVVVSDFTLTFAGSCSGTWTNP
jgi:Flp pilus assembly protein TadG